MKGFIVRILGSVARGIIRKYKPRIVGVTGNVGKTSTRDAVARVLGSKFRVRSASGNFNNEFGLPLSIIGEWKETGGVWFWMGVLIKGWWMLLVRRPYPEVLVLEYGIDRPGDMEYLLGIAKPDIGVFSALEGVPVHVEFFPDAESLAAEKGKLVASLPTTGFAVLNADNALVLSSGKGIRAHVLDFGFSEGASVRIRKFGRYFDGIHGGISFILEHRDAEAEVKIDGVLGRSGAYVAASAAAVGLVFGMGLEEVAESLGGYAVPAGRGRLLPGIKKSMILDDTYNASPLSMQEALDTTAGLEAKRKVCVLGDMLELGRYTLEAHEDAGRSAAQVCDILVTVGVRGKLIAESAASTGMKRSQIFTFQNIREAGMQVQQKIRKGDLILVKGSQGVRMERVVKEIMAEPGRAGELLVRQSPAWLKKPGLYD